MSTRAPGRKRRSAWSEGVASTVSPIERRRTTSTRRTVDQSHSARPSGRASPSPTRRTASTPTVLTTSGDASRPRVSARLKRLVILHRCLFDYERGDVVAHGIDAAALCTLDAARVLLQDDAALAGGAE